jgi:cytochrome c oxidase cbb3-type subunit 3
MATDPRQDHLLDHSYDGIQEYDNPLPRWWVWIFYATIAFSIVYAFDVTGRVKGPGREREYARQLADAAKRWPRPVGAVDAASLATLAARPDAIASGRTVFATTCASCHRPDGGGLIGPNLTDEYSLHGASLSALHQTIADGVPEKGMPAWGKMLKPEQIDVVTVYVASLRGTNPPDPKPPQGDKVPADTTAPGK